MRSRLVKKCRREEMSYGTGNVAREEMSGGRAMPDGKGKCRMGEESRTGGYGFSRAESIPPTLSFRPQQITAKAVICGVEDLAFSFFSSIHFPVNLILAPIQSS
jgi:hypothetical protein